MLPTSISLQLSVSSRTPIPELCEKCAHVMKQGKLVPSSFLALYFSDEILSPHAALLGKVSV